MTYTETLREAIQKGYRYLKDNTGYKVPLKEFLKKCEQSHLSTQVGVKYYLVHRSIMKRNGKIIEKLEEVE